MRSMNLCLSAAAVLVVGALAHAGPPLKIDVIAKEGEIPATGNGEAIVVLNPPFTNSLGQVGFTGRLGASENFVWFNDGIVFKQSDALPKWTLTGNEASSGISDTGGFIYSPSASGNDSVFTHNGMLLMETQPLPQLPGLFSRFNSRPRMLPNGTATWIGGTTTTQGGATSGNVLWVSPDTADFSSAIALLKSGDVIDGFTVAGSGSIGFAFDVSDNANHAATVVTMTGQPTASNDFLWVDGTLPLREGNPVGDGTTWLTFRCMSINDSGNWVAAGTTSGLAATNEYIAYNGQIKIRRGDTIDGVLLASIWAVRWASINNLGKVAYIWEGGSGLTLGGALFIGDADDPANTSTRVVSIGEQVDTNDDGIADAVVSNFIASATIAPGLDFSDHDFAYIEVDLQDILKGGGLGAAYEAIIRVPGTGPTEPACPGDLAPPKGDGIINVDDLLVLLGAWGACDDPNDCPADLAPAGGDDNVNVDDLLVLLALWGPCQ